MPRFKSPKIAKPIVIDPNSVYTPLAAIVALGVPKTCLPREIKLGRLKASWRAGRYFFLGKWLIEWVASGEVPASRWNKAA